MGYAYNPDGGWTATHQMSINGKFDGITRKDLLECANRNNIKEAAQIIDQICEISAGWPAIAAECGVPQDMIRPIEKNMALSI